MVRPDNDGASLAQIFDNGIIELRHKVTLQAHTIRSSRSGLVDVDLDCDGHPGEHAGILALRNCGIDRFRLREGFFWTVIDHGVDRGIDRIEARESSSGSFLCGDFSGSDLRCEVSS